MDVASTAIPIRPIPTNAAAGAVGRAHTRRCGSIDRPAWPTCIARYHQCWVLRGRLSDLSMHASRCMHGDCRQIINIAVIKGSSRRPSRLVGHLVWSLLFNSSTVSAGVDLDTYARGFSRDRKRQTANKRGRSLSDATAARVHCTFCPKSLSTVAEFKLGTRL